MKEKSKSDSAVSTRYMLSQLFDKLRRQDPGLIAHCLIYTLFASIDPLLGVWLPRLLLGQLEAAGPVTWSGGPVPAETAPVLRNLGLILLAYFLAASAAGSIRNYFSQSSYARLSYLRMDYIRDLTRKVLTMDFRYYEDASFMDRQNRVNRAIQSNDTGVEQIYRQLYMLPASLVSAVLLLAVLAQAGLLLAFLPILSFAGLAAALILTGRFRFSLREETMAADRRLYLYNQMAQDFSYGKDVRLYGLEATIFTAYRNMVRRSLHLAARIARRQFGLGFLPLALQTAATALTLLILSRQVFAGTLPVSAFVLYTGASVALMQLMDQTARNLVSIMDESRYVKEMLAFLREDLNRNSGTAKVPAAGGLSVEFEDVSFRYPGSDKLVLDHVSFRIEPGEKLALVGVNGAGKSTIVKLMTGLHHPTSGRVLINGADTRKLEPRNLMDQFSVVFQNETPLAFTVSEHVSGRLDGIDRDKVRSSLERMGLWDKVSSQPQGLDQMLQKIVDENGLMLSGGESQKLMLARAAYKDAPAVILDEPTSALDAMAETRIYQDFSQAMAGKTALFISHRLASTSFCDRILLLSGGVIAEQGTHNELLLNRQDYYDMFVTQGKYYQDSTADTAEKETAYALS